MPLASQLAAGGGSGWSATGLLPIDRRILTVNGAWRGLEFAEPSRAGCGSNRDLT